MINLLNYNLLIYVVITCAAILLSYFLYNLIKKNILSKKIVVLNNNSSNLKAESLSNNKKAAYRYIVKFSSIPTSNLNGNENEPTYTIYEIKYEEITTEYAEDLAEFKVTDEEVWDTINSFEEAELYANDVNDIILTILSYIHT